MILATERDKVAHLLRRFGLGASPAEAEFYGRDGLRGAMDRLLDPDGTAPGWDVNRMAFANRAGTVNLRVMQAVWYLRILTTRRPLEEKMTVFWHGHFATSAQKVANSFAMDDHVDVIRRNALGKFPNLLLAVSKDPAMLFWLDNQENVKGRPNENFAREVMELFTLGIGQYTEADVREAARAYTGWAYGVRRPNNGVPRGPDNFLFLPERHDNGNKTVLGKTGAWNGEDINRILCERPETALFLTRKVWDFFAGSTPSTALVERLAQRFRASGLDIKALLRAVMESDEFYSDAVARRLVKNPVDFVIPTIRQLGVGERAMTLVRAGVANPQINPENGINRSLLQALAPAFAARTSMTAMGMELMYPPDVSGWHPGAAWISSATMLERVKWADRLFAGSRPPARSSADAPPAAATGGNRVPTVNFPAWTLLQGDPTPEGVVRTLTRVFDITLAPAQTRTLVEAAASVGGRTLTQAKAGDTARAVAKLVFGSPEFQMA